MARELEKVFFVVVDNDLMLLEELAGELLERGFHLQSDDGVIRADRRNYLQLGHVTAILTNSVDRAVPAIRCVDPKAQECGAFRAIFLDWNIAPITFSTPRTIMPTHARAINFSDVGGGLDFAVYILSNEGGGAISVYCIADAPKTMRDIILERVPEREGLQDRVIISEKNPQFIARQIYDLAVNTYGLLPEAPRRIRVLFERALRAYGKPEEAEVVTSFMTGVAAYPFTESQREATFRKAIAHAEPDSLLERQLSLKLGGMAPTQPPEAIM